MAAADRETAESHLVSCRLCRTRLIALFDEAGERSLAETVPVALKNRAVQSAPVDRPAKSVFDSFRPYVPVALAATIVLAVGLSVLVYRNQTTTQRTTEFRQTDRSTGEISLTNPPNGAALTSGQLEFRWGAVGADARYEFTVTDEKGDLMLQEKPPSNFLTLDTVAARLSPGQRYYWSVTARLPDGTRRESPIAGFTVK